MSEERYVLITTEHRGVFAGYSSDPLDATVVTLRRPRLCVHWTAEVRGVLGLAVSGPLPGCRITPGPPRGVVRAVTAAFECTEEARRAWEEGFWSAD